MLPGKRDFYRFCKTRRSATYVNKEFGQQFQNYAPPSLRVIRTRFARTIYNIIITRKMVPIMGRASTQLKLFCMYDKRFEIQKTKWNGGGNRTTDVTIYPRLKYSPLLQLHHLILAFIIHNQIIFVYIHKYIHAYYIMNCSKK